ncbi:MAG: hypothetical protein KAJ05_11665 [Candidatus Latescibacteria bacterium]|nr:hypothetical protein [Candidatus Latescibacterota bacterium]MCK5527799.1 hypothetical protein [Candidatus Latescibacterota bacterium]
MFGGRRSDPAGDFGIEKLRQLHRRVWRARNKAFGFEVQCVPYGGLMLRLEEVAFGSGNTCPARSSR